MRSFEHHLAGGVNRVSDPLECPPPPSGPAGPRNKEDEDEDEDEEHVSRSSAAFGFKLTRMQNFIFLSLR